MTRIYLDNAATSWPKPESVYTAVESAMRVNGSPAGRGAYQDAVESLRLVEQTRSSIAQLINASHRRNIAFTFNGTDALSTAIFGLLKKGDHVVTSVVEHNSVLRPLKYLESTKEVTVTYVGCDDEGRLDDNDIIAAVRPETRLICLIHVSNVTGTIQPIENIKSKLRNTGNSRAIFLLDAAQSLGHLPIDVQALGCDMLAAPGHKGLLGPLGTGILYINDETAESVNPLRYGGTGTEGSIEIQPTKVPDKYESGNLNLPGIAGLNAGINFINSAEGQTARANWQELSQTMLSGIRDIPGIAIQGVPAMKGRIGVFSISIEGFDCHEASSILDSNWSIQTRSGIHCAPMIHRAMDTQSGTLRISPGLFNTPDQIDVTLDALSQLAKT